MYTYPFQQYLEENIYMGMRIRKVYNCPGAGCAAHARVCVCLRYYLYVTGCDYVCVGVFVCVSMGMWMVVNM